MMGYGCELQLCDVVEAACVVFSMLAEVAVSGFSSCSVSRNDFRHT